MDSIEKWKPFIYYVARKFKRAGYLCGLEIEDLVQVGFENALRALKKLDPNATEYEKTGYMRTRIFGGIVDEIRRQSITARRDFEHFKRSGESDRLRSQISFDEEYLLRYTNPSVLTTLIVHEFISRSQLTPFESHVLYLFFINGCTMHEIAEHFGYTESRISQLISSVLQKIRVVNDVSPRRGCLRGARLS